MPDGRASPHATAAPIRPSGYRNRKEPPARTARCAPSGQNFVHDPNTVRRIVRTAAVGPDDVVLEVGPGLGSLTLALLPAPAHVHAVEIDPALAARLPQTVARFAADLGGRLTVHHRDALAVAADELRPAPTALANLPYNVAVPLDRGRGARRV
jgi:16S rRNA (adenine1518-N6/adenine1519-N6)-dimethyltransferase